MESSEPIMKAMWDMLSIQSLDYDAMGRVSGQFIR